MVKLYVGRMLCLTVADNGVAVDEGRKTDKIRMENKTLSN